MTRELLTPEAGEPILERERFSLEDRLLVVLVVVLLRLALPLAAPLLF